MLWVSAADPVGHLDEHAAEERGAGGGDRVERAARTRGVDPLGGGLEARAAAVPAERGVVEFRVELGPDLVETGGQTADDQAGLERLADGVAVDPLTVAGEDLNELGSHVLTDLGERALDDDVVECIPGHPRDRRPGPVLQLPDQRPDEFLTDLDQAGNRRRPEPGGQRVEHLERDEDHRDQDLDLGRLGVQCETHRRVAE
nr:hypothetical protein Ade03nite_66600 [Actinoplanes derwentensis]